MILIMSFTLRDTFTSLTRSFFSSISGYVAPRNLPSAGFFPFLQTLMCNTDSSCSNKSYLDRTTKAYSTFRSHRERRDTDTHSSSDLPDGFPPLAHLQKGGLVHAILKRDTSNQSEILELWDSMLNSSTEVTSNMTTTILDALNSTVAGNQDEISTILESLHSLKTSFCGFSMSVLNSSHTDQMTSAVVKFCKSNDTMLEVSFSTLNELMAQYVLKDPVRVIESIEMAVIGMSQLQKQTSVWDFLLGLPDVFRKATEQERIMSVAERLQGLKGVLTSIQSSFPQANISMEMLNPVINESIDVLNYLRTWEGRQATVSLADVLVSSNQSLMSPEISTLIQHVQIPLDKVAVLFDNNAFYTFLCSANGSALYCDRSIVDMVYGRISQEKVALQMLLAWSQSAAPADFAFFKGVLGSLLNEFSSTGASSGTRSQRSSDSQPQSFQEQMFLQLGNAAMDMLKGTQAWDYINLLLMEAHSFMKTVTAAMEVEIGFMQPVLQDAEKLQEMFMSLTQNETEANVWVNRVMDSAVQTVTKFLMGHMDCPSLASPWAWISEYSSMDPELWAAIICPGNGSQLENVLMAQLTPLAEQVKELISVTTNGFAYNVTPSMILTEWHSLYSTSSKYSAAIQELVGELEHEDYSEWMMYNITVSWPQILMTRGLEKFEVMGSLLQNSSYWASMEQYFQMAYWILTFQPNVTAPPNCTITSDGTVCHTGFTWEGFTAEVTSLLHEVRLNPAALLRPIQGAEFLLQSIYRDTYMDILKRFLGNSGHILDSWSPENILLSLTALVDTNIQLLSNITSINQLDDDILIPLLSDLVEAFGLGDLKNVTSARLLGSSETECMLKVVEQALGLLQVMPIPGDSQEILSASLRTVYEQHLYAQKVYGEIALWYLHKLENATSESMFRKILVPLIRLAEVEVEISAAEANFSTLMSSQIQDLIAHVHPPLDGAELKMISNVVMNILQENMTIPSDIEAQLMNYLNLTMDWMKNPQLTTIIAKIFEWSGGSGQMLGNESPQKLLNILQLLKPESIQTLTSEGQFALLDAIIRVVGGALPSEQQSQLEVIPIQGNMTLSWSTLPNANVTSIHQALQDLNLTMSDLEPFTQLPGASYLPLILSNLMDNINISECLNAQFQNVTSQMGPPGSQTILSASLEGVYEQLIKLWNMHNTQSDPLLITQDVLNMTLKNIRENLHSFNLDNDTLTLITDDLQLLEELLNMAIREHYPYNTINSTLMSQPLYAQKVYGEIMVWYLRKLENATNESSFRNLLYPFLRMAEMQVITNAAQSNFSILVSSEIQNLMDHVQLPLDDADLNRISNAVTAILQGELQLLKMNLDIQQAFFDSMGFHMNTSIPTGIEAEIMKYLNLTQSWITNPGLTQAFAKILQWNSSHVDITTPGMDLEYLIQAIAPLLSPEEKANFDVIEQLTQALNHALQVATTDGGLESDNFTEAIMDSVRVLLNSTFNGSIPLPESAINNVSAFFNLALQMFLNSNMSYAQSQQFIVQAAIKARDFISILVPESAGVLDPIINSIISYIDIVSKPRGPDIWSEVAVNLLDSIQFSLPWNSTAISYISVIKDVINILLNYKPGISSVIDLRLLFTGSANLWGNLGGLNITNLDELAKQIGEVLDAMLPFLPNDQNMTSFTPLTESVPILVQILSGNANQLTFDRLKSTVAAVLSIIEGTDVGDTLPSTLEIVKKVTASAVQSINDQTNVISSLSEVLFVAVTEMNPTNVSVIISALPQALQFTLEATLQAAMNRQVLNCSEVEMIWEQVSAAAGLNNSMFASWCNERLLPMLENPLISLNQSASQNVTVMDPQWLNTTAAEITMLLEDLYQANLNEWVAMQHLSQTLMQGAVLLNLSLSAVGNQINLNALAFQLQQQQSSSLFQMILETLEVEAPLSTPTWRPFVLAVQKTVDYTLQDSYFNQNVIIGPQIVMQAVEIALTAMNVSSESINAFLSSDIFTTPNNFPIDVLIKDMIRKIIDMKLLGDWPMVYDLLYQLTNVDDSSQILENFIELVNWHSSTQDTGVNLAMQFLPKLYEMIKAILPAASQLTSPLPSSSNLFIELAGNALYLLKQISSTSSLFAPIDNYLIPIQMQLSQGQNLGGLISQSRNSRRLASMVQREPVDDFLDLLEIDYATVAQILSVPLSSQEILETVHMFFANPDLAVILKGMSGNSVQDETIDRALSMLSYLTLPSNEHSLMEMFMQISSEGWSLDSLKTGQLAESVGRIINLASMLSQESPLSIAQRVEQMVQQFSSAVPYIFSQQSNGTGLDLLTAINSILSQNLQEMPNISSQIQSFLQNIIASIPASGSQTDLAPYVQAIHQTAKAVISLLPVQEAAYFNISAQMMEAFALLASNPANPGNVQLSIHMIANALNQTLTFSGMTTLPNGQPIQEITYPFLLSSALSTGILLNLSLSNYTFRNDQERDMILTQAFNQMSSTLPVEVQVYLHPLKAALFYALSNVTSTDQIQPAFFKISQQVTMSLLTSLNVTGDPAHIGMTPGSLAHVLFTVSSEISRMLYESLLAGPSSMQFPYVLSSVREVMMSSYFMLPAEKQQWLNISLQFMDGVAFALNHTMNTGNVMDVMGYFASSIQSLLAVMPNMGMDTSGIVSNLENTLKMLLMGLSSGEDPLTQSANMTQHILLTIKNLLSQSGNNSEMDIARMILMAAEMSAGPLLMMNNNNWVDNLPLVLTSIANSLPESLQFGPLNTNLLRSLANESQENLNLLLQTIGTASELLYTNWMNDSFSVLLGQMQTQVCMLEKMESVQQLSQAVSFVPGLLCKVVLPATQTLHVIANNLVNQSTGVYEQLFRTLVGDPTNYVSNVDWSSILSNLLGINLNALGNIEVNMTSQSVVKMSDLLKNKTLFVLDVIQYTNISPEILNTLLESSLPNSNLQILGWLANLRYCPNSMSLELDPTGRQIFTALCSWSPQDWYTMAVLLARHIDMDNAIYRLMLSSEIQGMVGVLMQMLKFFTEIMNKLAPALNRLQEYLTSFGDLNLMANSEFRNLVRSKRSTMTSRATFVTLSRAMCKNGILSLFGISKLPNLAESDPSFKDEKRVEELLTKFKIPRDATPFCTNLYLDMVSTTGGAVAWAFLKPMLLGKVMYSPDTPLTRAIIKKTNSTLQQFGDLRMYAEEWLHSSSYLMQSAQVLNKTLPMLMSSLHNPFVQNFIKKQTDIDVTQMQETLQNFSNMTQMLQENKLVVQQISTLSSLMMNLSSCVNFNRYEGYNSTEDMEKQAEKLSQNRELYASVIFKLRKDDASSSSSSSLPSKVDYTIRMHIDNSMRTDRSRNPFWMKSSYISPLKTQRYIRGFSYLQEGIERAIIAMQAGKEVHEPAVQVQAFPYPCFYKDEYLNSISFAFPLVLMLAWVLFIANFVKKLVHERELRLHEYMKMMGVNPISHFFAWFIESAVFLLITIIILTVILKFGKVLPNSDAFVIFLYLCDYGLSILAISFLVSSFFDKTNIAGLSGSLIYVICFFPFIVVMSMEETMSFAAKSALRSSNAYIV
ncbi:hypothetical protein NFI96_020720 [Prochilodus magdalenae]|nr:hypothetical protein NFI96_020720 [Prochilodus magdalenae]